jgi:hypothetical protein
MGAGFLTFPGDNNNNNNQPYKAEGPTHCHGFGGVDHDVTDPSVVYRGNNLFYISMYDHMYQRGYVCNIEGAPMCGCAEVMPVVTRADCTQMAVTEKFAWTYDFDKKTFSVALTDISIKCNACTGIDQNGKADNNDLWPYANRLFIEGCLSRSKLQALSRKLIGDNRCYDAEKRMLASRGLSRGYNNDADEWTILAGREALGNETYISKQASKYLIDASNPLILRCLCASGIETQQFLYYKRLTPIPDQLNLADNLMFDMVAVTGNSYGVDFLIFSSYEDAKDPNNMKAWICPSYAYTKGFPGSCGPGGTVVTSQEVIFGTTWSKTDAAWYVEARERTLTPVVTTLIGSNKFPGSAFTASNTLYLAAAGSDIWGTTDSFSFFNTPSTGDDVTLVVHITNFDYRQSWSKTGLMIRESNAPGSRNFFVLLTGTNGVQISWRKDTNGGTTSRGQTTGLILKEVWLKLTKVGNVYTGYQSVDGLTWVMINAPQTLLLGNTNLPTGLAVTSRDSNRLSETVFANYTIGQIPFWA